MMQEHLETDICKYGPKKNLLQKCPFRTSYHNRLDVWSLHIVDNKSPASLVSQKKNPVLYENLTQILSINPKTTQDTNQHYLGNRIKVNIQQKHPGKQNIISNTLIRNLLNYKFKACCNKIVREGKFTSSDQVLIIFYQGKQEINHK